ncbi:MAG: DHA2 family efflux MFS transporter permease subunit [Acidimicrobiia bacterium]|nr:DHA2 family efflux MFS transporter permease subunit [Acidimicrobiia bacterium]
MTKTKRKKERRPLTHDGDRYPWIAMGVVLIGTFMVILDTTIVNVALPQIGVALDSESGIEWVVTAYLLAVGIAQPPTGWLADRYGRKRLFIASLAAFALGSLFAALSPNLETLVIARVVQGLGGGALAPVGMAMVYELFPTDRRGTALGVWGVAAMVAPAFGPVVGGYLVTNVSWHWLFLINVPIGVIAIVAAVRLLRETGYREERPFDGVGLGLISVGLVTLLLTFSNASDWGWTSGLTIGLIATGGLFLLGFILWERRQEHPLINLSMFRVPIFTLTLGVIGATVIVQFGMLVFLPLQLQTIREFTALEVGTMLVPMAIAAAITFPLGGRLTDRIGPRIPVVTGSILLAASAFILAQLEVDSPTYIIEIALICQGFGFGLSMMPNSVTGLNALPNRFVAQATSVRQLHVRVMASFGVAVLATLLAVMLGDMSATGTDVAGSVVAQDAYNTVFMVMAGSAVLAAIQGIFLPGKERNRELQSDRAAEYATAVEAM